MTRAARLRKKKKTTKMKDATPSNDDQVHDSAISRVIGIQNPSADDFSPRELVCIIKHLDLKPVAARKKVIISV